MPSQNANSKASSVDSLGHPNHFNATSTNNAAQGSQQQQQQQPSHNQTQFNHAANVTAKKDSRFVDVLYIDGPTFSQSHLSPSLN